MLSDRKSRRRTAGRAAALRGVLVAVGVALGAGAVATLAAEPTVPAAQAAQAAKADDSAGALLLDPGAKVEARSQLNHWTRGRAGGHGRGGVSIEVHDATAALIKHYQSDATVAQQL
jgi:hypothetical protein